MHKIKILVRSKMIEDRATLFLDLERVPTHVRDFHPSLKTDHLARDHVEPLDTLSLLAPRKKELKPLTNSQLRRAAFNLCLDRFD